LPKFLEHIHDFDWNEFKQFVIEEAPQATSGEASQSSFFYKIQNADLPKFSNIDHDVRDFICNQYLETEEHDFEEDIIKYHSTRHHGKDKIENMKEQINNIPVMHFISNFENLILSNTIQSILLNEPKAQQEATAESSKFSEYDIAKLCNLIIDKFSDEIQTLHSIRSIIDFQFFSKTRSYYQT